MSTPSLDELLTIPDQQAVLDQSVLPELRVRGVRVTDWVVGGAYRTMAYVVAALGVQTRSALAAIAAAGFEDYAFGFSTVLSGIDVTGWAPLVAKQRYGVDRIEATYTRRKIRLTNAVATPYGPLSPGAIILSFPTGNRYILDQSVTIPASGFVDAVFRSEFAVNSASGLSYVDSADSAIVFVTASYPGVVATNPAATYSDVSSVGAGPGTLTLSGFPSQPHSVAVRIDASGIAGTATWSTMLDGGAWDSRGNATSIANLGGSGITINLTDNGGNPSFAAGSYYYFSAPGSDVTQVGRDAETPQELGTRCRGLWPSLAFAKDGSGTWIPGSPTMGAYEALARSISDQIRVCFLANGGVNNEVKIYVYGQGAALPAGVIAKLQAFFTSRTMLTDLPVVAQPAPRTITLAGATITVSSGMMATAQAALTKTIQGYISGVDTGAPLSVNGRVDHAYLVSLIRRTAGVTKLTDGSLTINGAAADLQLPVTPGAYEVAQLPGGFSSASAFTWATG